MPCLLCFLSSTTKSYCKQGHATTIQSSVTTHQSVCQFYLQKTAGKTLRMQVCWGRQLLWQRVPALSQPTARRVYFYDNHLPLKWHSKRYLKKGHKQQYFCAECRSNLVLIDNQPIAYQLPHWTLIRDSNPLPDVTVLGRVSFFLRKVRWMPSCSPFLSLLHPLTLRGLKLLGRQIFVFELHGISVLPDMLSWSVYVNENKREFITNLFLLSECQKIDAVEAKKLQGVVLVMT